MQLNRNRANKLVGTHASEQRAASAPGQTEPPKLVSAETLAPVGAANLASNEIIIPSPDASLILVRANISDDFSDASDLAGRSARNGSSGLEQKLRVAGPNRGAAQPHSTMAEQPGRLSAQLEQDELRVSQHAVAHHARSDQGGISEAQHLSGSTGAPPTGRTEPSAATLPTDAAALGRLSEFGVFDFRAAVLSVPSHWYVSILIACAAVLALSLARRPSSRSSDGSIATSPLLSFPAIWPIRMAGSADNRATGSSVGDRSGMIAGIITSVFGAGIAVLGISILIRQVQIAQPALQRPGLMIAAIGQLVLLSGISIQIVSRTRRSRQHSGEAVAATVPIAAIQPIWAPAIAAQPNTAGVGDQIAQLKADVAVLSERIDHLAK